LTALATSDLCINSGEASVGDCFWSNDVSQGISVAPKQLIYMNPFITFPSAPGIIPFSFSEKDVEVSEKDNKIFTLIETDLLPHFNQQASALEVKFASSLALRHNHNVNSFSFYTRLANL
jgi:hypothetical protein